jgi:hypothetical protein
MKEKILKHTALWSSLTINGKLEHISRLDTRRLESQASKKSRHDASKERKTKKSNAKKNITPKIFLKGKNLELFNTLPEEIRKALM